MSCMEKLHHSHLNIHHLSSPSSQKALNAFLSLLDSCAGPAGEIHLVHNACGGHVTLTSSCTRLLVALSISRPELKLIVSSVQAHLKQYGDCGLFMACTCFCLITSYLEKGIHFSVQSSVCDKFVQMLRDYLHSSDCCICVKADFTDLQVLLAYVRSILKSKCLLGFTSIEREHFSELVIRTFVESIPTQWSSTDVSFSDRMFIANLEKRHVTESRLVHGLLVEYTELPVICGAVKLNVRSINLESDKGNSEAEIKPDHCVIVALFTCSMSGDMRETYDATYEVTKEQSQDVENIVINKMLSLCDNLEASCVGIVLCQRVIHPRVKATLKSKNILFVDRLGSQVIPYLRDLTGAQPIASLMVLDNLSKCLGCVESVSHVVEGSKGFLHLIRPGACIVTLVLCAQWEERHKELKSCIRTALKGLQYLSRDPRLLAGGGCWQAHCSFVLLDLHPFSFISCWLDTPICSQSSPEGVQVQQQLSAIAEQVGCTEAQVLSSLATFRLGLHHWVNILKDSSEEAVFDPHSLHCWTLPKGNGKIHTTHDVMPSCCCGLKSLPIFSLQDLDVIPKHENLIMFRMQKTVGAITATDNAIGQSTVLDSFPAATQALWNAAFTANLVLSTDHFVIDHN